MPSTYFGWSMFCFYLSFLLSLDFVCVCAIFSSLLFSSVLLLNREQIKIKCMCKFWVLGSFTCTLRVWANNDSRCENLTVCAASSRDYKCIICCVVVQCAHVLVFYSVYVLMASFSWFACVTESRYCTCMIIIIICRPRNICLWQFFVYYSHFDSYIPYTYAFN